jgi:hypothetical protein
MSQQHHADDGPNAERHAEAGETLDVHALAASPFALLNDRNLLRLVSDAVHEDDAPRPDLQDYVQRAVGALLLRTNSTNRDNQC